MIEINKYYENQIVEGLKKELWQSMFEPIFAILSNNNVLNSVNNEWNESKHPRDEYGRWARKDITAKFKTKIKSAEAFLGTNPGSSTADNNIIPHFEKFLNPDTEKSLLKHKKLMSFNVIVNNSNEILINAIKSGYIYYENGAFKARERYSNAVAKELIKLGAKFKYGAYYIDRTVLPIEIENALAFVAAREAAKITALMNLLGKLALTIDFDTTLKQFIQSAAENMFKRLEYDLDESLKNYEIPIIEDNFEIPKTVILEDETTEELFKDNKSNKEAKAPDKDKPKDKPKDNIKDKVDDTEAVKISEDKLKDIEAYWKSTDKQADKLREKWEQSGKEEDRINLGKFREKQKKNAPKLDYEKDVKGFEDLKISNRAKKIAEDYTYNMQYWVKKWKGKNIIKMREDVLKLVQSGKRIDTITEYFKKEWGIAEKKAKFLARNEAGIAWSVICSTKWQEAGFTYFYWIESTSHEKRLLHLDYAKKEDNQYGLFGKNIFAFDNPPILEEVIIKDENGNKIAIPKPNGQRGLPKQTYNCECSMRPYRDENYLKRRLKIENAKRNVFKNIANSVKNCFKRNNTVYGYHRFGTEGQAF